MSLPLVIVGSDPPSFPENIPNDILLLLGISAITCSTGKVIETNHKVRMAEINARISDSRLNAQGQGADVHRNG